MQEDSLSEQLRLPNFNGEAIFLSSGESLRTLGQKVPVLRALPCLSVQPSGRAKMPLAEHFELGSGLLLKHSYVNGSSSC